MKDIAKQETEILTPCITVTVKISKWDEYGCGIDQNGTKYIMGFNEKPKDSFQWVKIENGELLFLLIKLYRDIYLSCNEIFSSNQDYVNEIISDSVISLILNFCKKQGLPFWNRKRTANIFKNMETKYDGVREQIISDIPYFSDMVALPICSFISGLNSLHTDFLNMVAFKCWHTDALIDMLLTDTDKKYVEEKTYDKHFDLYTPCLCNFITRWDSIESCLQMQCENIMQIAVYHLCILFQSDNFNGCGGNWRICKKCGQIFYASRSNQKYCRNPCSKQAAYSSRKRHNMRTNKTSK